MGMYGYSVVAVGLPYASIKDEIEGDPYDFFEDKERCGKLQLIWDANGFDFVGIILDEDTSDYGSNGLQPKLVNFQTLNFLREEVLEEYKKHFNKTFSIDKVGLIYGHFWR